MDWHRNLRSTNDDVFVFIGLGCKWLILNSGVSWRRGLWLLDEKSKGGEFLTLHHEFKSRRDGLAIRLESRD